MCALGPVLSAAVLVALLVGGGPASATPSSAPTGTVRTSTLRVTGSDRPLTVVSESPWVAAGQNFDLHLRIGGAVPAGDLGLTVNVYPCLSSVSAFDQSLSTSTLSADTPIFSTSAPLPVSSLPVVNGSVDLSLPVGVGTADASPTPGGPTIDLSPAGDECGAYPTGVYPVWVQLVDLATTNRQIVAQFTTHLIYTEGDAGTQRLRVAVVLPVELPALPSRSPSPSQLLARPGAAVAQPSDAEVSGLDATLGVLDTSPTSTVPVTVEASPLTVQLLAQSGHPSTLAGMVDAASNPSVHQFLSAPFAPVNAAALVDSGLGSELTMQVTRGAAVLGATVTHSAATVGISDLGAWVTNDALDSGSIGQLATLGYSQVVLPSAGVNTPPADGSATEPFSLSTAHGHQVTAITSDADLSARFAGSATTPVLAAHQLLAELAQIYYEKPNDSTPRMVVAVAPNGWKDNPTFVAALLSALVDNPIIEPVTTKNLFAAFGPAAACRDGCRLQNVGSGGAPLPVAGIRAQRQRIDGFASAVRGAPARIISLELGDLVLASQSEDLRLAQQDALLENTAAALNAQLSQLQVAGDRTVTLTSQQGTLPVTIVSSTSYPVTGTLTLTSDKLLFPNGTTEWTQPVRLVLPNNVVDVKVRARASGVFKVDVSLRSPSGGLELSNGEVEVRSTATSVVGIVLSVGALTVLVVWWFRTSRKRRALRKAEEGKVEEGADLVSETR
jgi:hypothetical protein